MVFVLIFILIQIVFHFLGVNKRIHHWALNKNLLMKGESYVSQDFHRTFPVEETPIDLSTFPLSSPNDMQDSRSPERPLDPLSVMEEEEREFDEEEYMDLAGEPILSNKFVHSFMRNVAENDDFADLSKKDDEEDSKNPQIKD
jgi:hypothetical protein